VSFGRNFLPKFSVFRLNNQQAEWLSGPRTAFLHSLVPDRYYCFRSDVASLRLRGDDTSVHLPYSVGWNFVEKSIDLIF